MNKVLIVNPFGIGDVLFSTPLIAALKAQVPQVSISYIGNARTVDFLKNDPRLDKVFSYERDQFMEIYRRSPWQFLLRWQDFVQQLRAERFDVAFDLSMGSPLGMALVLAGVPVRAGYDHKGRGRWLTHKLPLKGYEGRHVAEYILDLVHLVGAPSGCPHRGGPRPPVHMSLHGSFDDQAWAKDFIKTNGLQEKGFIVIFPGGGASWGKGAGLKRWSGACYAKLAEKIIERSKCPIILMGDQSEGDLCRDVAEAVGRPVLVLAGQVSLLRSAALMAHARCVVANDGGPLHMAVACGVPTLSIFGPVDPAVYGPYPMASTHKVVVKGLPCQPCYRNFRMSGCGHQWCLKALTVDEVFVALKELVV